MPLVADPISSWLHAVAEDLDELPALHVAAERPVRDELPRERISERDLTIRLLHHALAVNDMASNLRRVTAGPIGADIEREFGLTFPLIDDGLRDRLPIEGDQVETLGSSRACRDEQERGGSDEEREHARNGDIGPPRASMPLRLTRRSACPPSSVSPGTGRIGRDRRTGTAEASAPAPSPVASSGCWPPGRHS